MQMRLRHVSTRLRRSGVLGRVLGWGLGLWLLAVCVRRVRRVLARTSDLPLSPLAARWRVSPAYLDRHDVATTGPVRGELDAFDELAYPGFDPDAVHPSVRAFYERTAAFTLRYSVEWHPGFRLGAALASPLTSAIGQLNLPGPREPSTGRLRSRLVGIDPETDPRDGARAWIRTDTETGEVVFVAVYATHRRNDVTYVNIAAPLPRTNLSTVLHVSGIPTGGEDDGLELTTTTDTGDEGLYLVTPLGTVPLPLDQTFRVYPAEVSGSPADDPDDDIDVVATHEMWLCGRKFLTVSYTT